MEIRGSPEVYVEDHYQTHDDFNSPKEMSDKIREILDNIDEWTSRIIRRPAANSKNKDKDDYTVVLTKDSDGYFVRTVFNYIKTELQKERTQPFDRESFIKKSDREVIEVRSSEDENQILDNSHTKPQLDHKDNNKTSNIQVFNKNFLEKSENNMTIFEYLKSKISNNPSNTMIIKGVSYRQVENGWIPDIDSISIFDLIEKGKSNLHLEKRLVTRNNKTTYENRWVKNIETKNEIKDKELVEINTPQEIYEKQIPTDKFYFDPIKNDWNENRIKNVHIPIIEDYVKEAKESSKPTVYLMMGGYGAGKGFIKDYLKKNNHIPTDFIDIDTDKVRENEKYLGKDFKGYSKVNSKTAGRMTQRESSNLSDQIIHNLRRKRSDLIIDQSFSQYDHLIRTINKFKKAGYQVNIIMAYQTLENALKGINVREKEIGRGIEEKYTTEVYKRIEGTTKKIVENLPEGVSFQQFQMINRDEPPVFLFSKDKDQIKGTIKIQT